MDPVSLLAASLLSVASLPPAAAKIGVTGSQRPTHAAARLTRKRGNGSRCKHGTPATTAPPVEAMQRQAGGSAPPDMAGPAPAASVFALVFLGNGLKGAGERDGPTPIPLLLLTQSLLI